MGASVVTENSGKLAGGLLLLVALWIGVFWWWPASEPRITFAAGEAVGEGGGDRAGMAVGGADGASTAPTPGSVAPGREAAIASEPMKSAQSVKTPPPPKPLAVIAPEFTDHTVRRGETFASIARRYYGSSGNASAVARANPFVSPQSLRPGRVVRVPKDPGNIQGKPNPEARPEPPREAGGAEVREHVVAAGETLSSIAKEAYGTVTLATHLYEANRDVLESEDALRVGQRLRIPARPE